MARQKSHSGEGWDQHGKEDGEENHLQGQQQGVFHKAGGCVVEIALSVNDVAPEAPQSHVHQIVHKELGQKQPEHRDLFPVEEQGVDQAAGHGAEGIARKKGAAGKQHIAQNIGHGPHKEPQKGPVDGASHSGEEERELHPEIGTHREEEGAHHNAQRTDQGGEDPPAQTFHFLQRSPPVGRGQTA